MCKSLAAIVGVALGLSGCVTPPRECEHVQTVTYRCVPLVIGRGCFGGPLQHARDEIYPIGCQVETPECSQFEPSLPRTFECAVGADEQPAWYEAI